MLKQIHLSCAIVLALGLLSCNQGKKEFRMIQQSVFGRLDNGVEVSRFTMANRSGMQVVVTNFGAAVTSILVPDKHGKLADVVLGYDSLDGYVKDKSYFGVIVGRYGNRIGKGKFSIDGREYQLTVNDGENHLHGGVRGFHKIVWDAEPLQTDSSQSVKLSITSPDGYEGYPGNVKLEVTYALTDKNELIIDYRGATDKTTILNPTHHSYFNLTGSPSNTILGHYLQIEADSVTPVDNGLITTGTVAPVAGTPMDFRVAAPIGLHIDDQYEQLVFGKGYDHNWVLRNFTGSVRKAAELYEPVSGRMMTVFTDQPGIQFYSGNFLDGTIIGKHNTVYNYRTGLCLEAQHYPDTPNKPGFPSVTLHPGHEYRQQTIYHFTTK